MSRSLRIITIIKDQFNPYFFELENESHNHSVPEEAESHFKMLVVDSRFESMSRVQAQKAIYELLKSEFQSGMHALSLKCVTPEQWKQDQVVLLENFKSPLCHSKV